jgi:type I restriction enzyme, S subunit
MADEWQTTHVSTAPLEIIDGDRGTNYPNQAEFSAAGHCLFLNAGNVTANGFRFSDCAFITAAKDAMLRKGKLRRGDVVLTTRGTVGNAAYFDDSVPYENIRINSAMVVLRSLLPALQPRFLYLFVRSALFHKQVESLRTGSAQPQLPIRDINQIVIPVPPPREQRAIAHILGTLDDKIELNRRMNETLEAMARALFKSWFVDFDPVRAKAEGRDPGFPKHIADLFPNSFEGSTLGTIPTGWRVSKLEGVLAELETGGRPKGGVSSYYTGIPSVGAESIVGLGLFDFSKTKYVPREFFDAMTRGHLKNRDVLLYKDGGRPGLFEPHLTLVGDGFPFDTCAINEHVYRIRVNPELGQTFLFFWLSSGLVMEEMRIKGTGVAIPGLNSTQVRSLDILVPPREIARAFDLFVDPWITRLLSNCNGFRILAALRDTLLPKLISGELRIPDAERLIGLAT